jgi:hypothetical protein
MSKPEAIVGDSDIDWGEDLRRARMALRPSGIPEVWLAGAGHENR